MWLLKSFSIFYQAQGEKFYSAVVELDYLAVNRFVVDRSKHFWSGYDDSVQSAE